MIFVKERLEVIAAQLKKFRIPQSFQLDSWKVKEGFWLRPEEVDADPAPFTDFDSKLMHCMDPIAITGSAPDLPYRKAMTEKSCGCTCAPRLRNGMTPKIPSS